MMPAPRSKTLAVIGISLVMVVGCARMARTGASGELPTCSGWSDCNAGGGICTVSDTTRFAGPTVVSDLSDGVSSDGRGPYIPGTEGVLGSGVGFSGGMGIVSPRTLTVNLNHPVPGGGGARLGIITDATNSVPRRWIGLGTQWKRVVDDPQNFHNIPVGQTVTAAQMNVGFHIDGRFHILQMGPQPLGHCHAGTHLVNGAGTSSGTIYRASQTKWVIDLPAGSVGRLFDLYNTTRYAVDKGLYYVRLHYEIGN